MTDNPTVDPTLTPAEPHRIRALAATITILLLAQVLLGLANTFWLRLPDDGSGWSTAAPMMLLNGHMMLGLATAVVAVWIAVVAIRGRDRAWTAWVVTGLLGIVVAFGSGIAFMGQVSNDVASYLMGVGTVVAIGAFTMGLARRRTA
jgi:hypothetical protein